MSNDEGGFGRNDGPREEHDAVCADCGAECKVPFKPSQGRDVRCGPCHKKHKGF